VAIHIGQSSAIDGPGIASLRWIGEVATMQFNVSELLRESYGAFREHQIDDDVRIDGAPRRLRGHVRFDRVPEGVFVRAALNGVAEGECSRCLDPAATPIELAVEELYVPVIDPVTGARVGLREGEEDAYRINERHIIDLTLPVQQYWAMAQPIAPVCSAECRGICPECGARRDASHDCAPAITDDRWSKLRDLKLRK
jgi:uncharacterized protein